MVRLVDMDVERRRRLTRLQVQQHCRTKGDSRRQQQQEADRRKLNLNHIYIGQSLVVAVSDSVAVSYSVAVLTSWLIYKCSDPG